MKTKLFLTIFMALALNTVFPQGAWTRKADFGSTTRQWAVGFSIGSKGYIGTGLDNSLNNTKDFWEFDPVTNVWTQKADFGGNARVYAVGFSIGNKGYLGTGSDWITYTKYKDFWEYDPIANIWSKKADFGGSARIMAVGFSIHGKGYIGTGSGWPVYPNDFWEYDPVSDVWNRKADFVGIPRFAAVGFSIGNNGYIGTGLDISGRGMKDFWQYDPVNNLWTQKADFGGNSRSYAVGFSIGDKGYIGTGVFWPTYFNDFWEYNPDSDKWFKKADFKGGVRDNAVGFSIGDKGYIGTGNYSGTYYKDFWEYSPKGSTCTQPSDLQASQITALSAKISWIKTSPPPPAFKIRYKIAGSPIVLKRLVKGTASSITLHDLQPNTSYEWKMRSACDEDKTDWIKGPSFTTAGVVTATAIVADNLQTVTPGQLIVSPNPAKGQVMVQLQLPDKIAPATFCLYNNQGTKVWQQYYGAIGGQVRQTIHLPATVLPGMYILVVEWSGNRYTQKLVVQ